MSGGNGANDNDNGPSEGDGDDNAGEVYIVEYIGENDGSFEVAELVATDGEAETGDLAGQPAIPEQDTTPANDNESEPSGGDAA